MIWLPSQARHPLCMASHGIAQLISADRIPDSPSIVHAAGRNPRIIWGPTHCQYPAGMALQDMDRGAGITIPNPCRVITTSTDHLGGRTGGELRGQNSLSMAWDRGCTSRDRSNPEDGLWCGCYVLNFFRADQTRCDQSLVYIFGKRSRHWFQAPLIRDREGESIRYVIRRVLRSLATNWIR